MMKAVFGFSTLLFAGLAAQAQVGTYQTINLPNTYVNTITTRLFTSNYRSGLVNESNGSINFGLTGAKANSFRYRWLAHDNGAIDYSLDTDLLMFLDGLGNLSVKGGLSTTGNVGIGGSATGDKVTVDMGATRGVFNITSDGDGMAYTDFKLSVKTVTNIATGKPQLWEASLRKDGYFSADLTGPTLEFYSLNKGGGYYAPLLLKSNGDIILAGARNAVNGNVGIGTTDTRGYKLAVNGDAIFTKIIVKTFTTWPDYVFEGNYALPSLAEVEQFIKTNKHLPDMPPAAEIKENGMDVEEMNRKLLQKVEELTLYMIRQQKEIAELKQQVSTLTK
ncbi:hypothetical protein F0L74_21310 [Chitinophaga agrisoli]|uniref:Uncharacterized protein n=1 Tax=Chitinophaga agrisoli TaxID=2607653 RepID=A0A5B2VJN3_9BACT|nr:hypothetical protein [Chitinophaga agrisoli]KAA2238756.1 hypothetical protein F0L74_21310 [Chitinophaga agrisoli]